MVTTSQRKAAVTKSSKSPGTKKHESVRIFVSHKHEDRDIANSIKEDLESYAADKLELFVSGKNLTLGGDYLAEIKAELRRSDLLLLLFTAPAKDWDWCLFEAGMFTPLISENERRRIISIHPPNGNGPSPLNNLHGVKADLKSLIDFLRSFYRTTEIVNLEKPLNAKLTDEKIEELAKKIELSFLNNQAESFYPGHRVLVRLPDDFRFNPDGGIRGIPHHAEVEGSDKSLALFGLGAGAHTWGKLAGSVPKHGLNNWTVELADAFEATVQRRLVKPVTAVMKSREDGQLFRPFIYKMEFLNERPATVHLSFMEESAAPDVGGPMFRLLKMATQFREEVIDVYHGKLHAMARKSDAESAINGLLNTISGVEFEASRARLDDRNEVLSRFSDEGNDRVIVSCIFEEWEKLRETLDAAHKDLDLDATEECLRKMWGINGRFMLLASRRYRELVEKEFTGNTDLQEETFRDNVRPVHELPK